jgi:hypothetical protein
MSEGDATNTSSVAMIPGSSEAPSHRAPPKAIHLLLPVWGQRYLKQFLNTCLPTLLAPGNLPALAAVLPCKFVFLTSSEDAEILRDHPTCRYLRSICHVDIDVIDDLITGDNHSTTITLAYARAVKAAGSAMLDTCFFFLISDYLMADGSLANVLERVMAGADGVLTGNFQVVEEDAHKAFHAKFDRGGPELVLAPRELMKWALAYLHPVTAGNTANFPLSHSKQSNRLFWRVDENTLIGRFYLMHMICIRPEVVDFAVGSSCDYSFIPEMCPSGNVEVIADSDQYLVVEMQPSEHENEFLRLGPKDPLALAGSLGEWTTRRHRENVRHQLVFHAADIPPSLNAVAREADAFIAEVDRRLAAIPPHFHRQHPYWIGAVIAHRLAVSRKFGHDVSPEAIYREYGRNVHIVQRFRDAFFGRPPDVRPWHPRWPDFAIMRAEMRQLLCGPRRRLLIVSKAPFLFADWLKDTTEQTTSMETRRLLAINTDHYAALVGSFEGCLLIMGESEIRQAQVLMARIAPLLTPGGFVAMSVISGRAVATDYGFGNLLTRYSGRFLGLTTPVSAIRFVRTGLLRAGATYAMIWLYHGMLHRPIFYYPLVPLLGPFLLLACLIGNVKAFLLRRKAPRSGVPSSLWMVFRPGEAVKSLPDLSPDPELYARADRYKTVAKPVRQRASLGERT